MAPKKKTQPLIIKNKKNSSNENQNKTEIEKIKSDYLKYLLKNSKIPKK